MSFLFKEGDLVTLKCGSPIMCVGTIVKATPHYNTAELGKIELVHCTWFDHEKRDFCSYGFRPDQLIYASISQENASNVPENVAST